MSDPFIPSSTVPELATCIQPGGTPPSTGGCCEEVLFNGQGFVGIVTDPLDGTGANQWVDLSGNFLNLDQRAAVVAAVSDGKTIRYNFNVVATFPSGITKHAVRFDVTSSPGEEGIFYGVLNLPNPTTHPVKVEYNCDISFKDGSWQNVTATQKLVEYDCSDLASGVVTDYVSTIAGMPYDGSFRWWGGSNPSEPPAVLLEFKGMTVTAF